MQLYEFISTTMIYFVVASSKAEAAEVLKRDVDALVNDPKWDYLYSELEDEDKSIDYTKATRIKDAETLDVMKVLPKYKLAHLSVGDIVATVQQPCLFSYGPNSSYSSNLSPIAKRYAGNLASVASTDKQAALEMPTTVVPSYEKTGLGGNSYGFELADGGVMCYVHKEDSGDYEWLISAADLKKAVDEGSSSTGGEHPELKFKNSGRFDLNDEGKNPKVWQFIIDPPRKVVDDDTRRAEHIYAILPFAIARGFVQQLGL